MSTTVKKILSRDDISQALEICMKVFEDHAVGWDLRKYLIDVTDWRNSYLALFNNKPVGCYLLAEGDITRYQEFSKEDLSRYKNLKGVEGIALAVLPDYRNSGVGKTLREYPKTLGYDYIYGEQLHSLNNLDKWLGSGRRMIANTGEVYVTLKDYKDNGKPNMLKESVDYNKHHLFQTNGYNCGPTAVAMVAKILGIENEKSSIDSLEEIMNCDSTTGTTDVGIKLGLDALGIKNERNPCLGEKLTSFITLNQTLKDGNIFVMRTLTRGVKHWILVIGMTKRKDIEYQVFDPWLGKITYSINEINRIWQPRDYDGFIVTR